MSARRVIVLLFVSAVATAGLGWLSRAPYTSRDADRALLRLSWRLRGEKSEVCRPRTQEELDALPVHMRTSEVCESTLLAYRLIVRVDGVTRDSTIVLPGGARGDRPVFVLRELPLEPGTHHVSIRFDRERADDDRDYRSPQQSANGAHPISLGFDTTLLMHAGRIELITLASDGARLVHIAPTEQR